jgi:hypothetical protein
MTLAILEIAESKLMKTSTPITSRTLNGLDFQGAAAEMKSLMVIEAA